MATVTAAVANLILGAYFESMSIERAGGYYLLLFLVCECLVVFTFSSSLFFSEQQPILLRTRIFPLHAGSRFAYLCLSLIRRPVFLLFWATGALAIGVMHRTAFSTMITGVLLFSLMVHALCMLILLGYLLCLNHGWPPAAATAGFLGGAICAGVIGIFLPTGSLVSHIPMVSWVGGGIAAAADASWNMVAVYCAFFVVLILGASFLGRTRG